MFRRHWSGLPKDAFFPSDLKGLGYFVNDEDEVRSIQNPNCYFKYFLNRNTRINDRQRFEFDGAVEKIIHERLGKQGLLKTLLPLGTSATKPHAPIFVSPKLEEKSRIVLVFGEPTQDLGILAGRMATGEGGLNKGSMVSVVSALQQQTSSPEDSSAPAILLANMGQHYWWPEGKRALTIKSSAAIPLPSMVHAGRRHFAAVNDIPGSEDPARHMEHLFCDVLPQLVGKDAKIDIIAIGDSCEKVEQFFDEQKNWLLWGHRLSAMLLMGTVYPTDVLTNSSFKQFLRERARGYLVSEEMLDAPLAAPEGNPSLGIEPMGCPCYSSSEPLHREMIMIRALEPALDYLQQAALAPTYENPTITVVDRPVEEFAAEDWENVAEHEKPAVQMVDGDVMKEHIKQLRRWRKFAETGEAPASDSESEDEVEEVVREDGALHDSHWAW